MEKTLDDTDIILYSEEEIKEAKIDEFGGRNLTKEEEMKQKISMLNKIEISVLIIIKELCSYKK